MTAPPAGWYVDPDREWFERYWDGSLWTEHRRKDIARLQLAELQRIERTARVIMVILLISALGSLVLLFTLHH
jgi:hypothetical protein